METLRVQPGLPNVNRAQAASLYYEAFARTLEPVLKPRASGVALVEESLDLDRAITAFSAGALVGLLGFEHGGRRFVQPNLKAFQKHFGWNGLFRAAVLGLFERSPKPNQLLLDGIAVQATARGQGIGTRLLEVACDLARQRGLGSIRLDVVDTNPGARRLYERLGFKPVSTSRYPYLRPIFGFGASTTMEKEV